MFDIYRNWLLNSIYSLVPICELVPIQMIIGHILILYSPNQEFQTFFKSTRFKQLNLCTVNKVLPPLIVFQLVFYKQSNSWLQHQKSKMNNYRVHHYRTNFKKFTIPYQGPKIWSFHPVTVTSLSSFPNFKKKLLEFLVK